MSNAEYLPFFRFVYDRQLIYHKRFRDQSPFPWTNDLVFKKYKFCNVYRQLDKGTIYYMEKIGANPNLSESEIIFNTFVYRFFNRYKFFDEILPGVLDPRTFDIEKTMKILDSKKDLGLFNSAYLTGSMVQQASPRGKHHDFLISLKEIRDELSRGLHSYLMQETDPTKIMKELINLRQVGKFLAYEIFTDLTYTGLILFNDNDYVSIGPGAEEGLVNMGVERENHLKELYHLRDNQESYMKALEDRDKIKLKWKDICIPDVPKLSARNIEHSLCEFRKYRNIVKSMIDPTFKCRKRFYNPPEK